MKNTVLIVYAQPKPTSLTRHLVNVGIETLQKKGHEMLTSDLSTGSPWADVPDRYGPPTTCYNRFVRWRKAGVWGRILADISKAFDGDIIMIDSSCVRVHGATAKRGSDNGCMGCSRGGLMECPLFHRTVG